MHSKKILPLLFTIISIGAACKKNNDKNAIPQPDPVKPDLSVKINSSVAGFVMDEANNPVPFAEVTAGDKKARTDEFGYFKVSSTSLPKAAGMVKIAKSGYFDGDRSFTPVENKESFVRIKLLAKKETGAFDAATGGTVTTTDGGQVTLPANAVVLASGGAAYTGQVHISARWINPADNADLLQSIPGDARGTDGDGYLKALKSYGLIAVELSATNGQLLQIALGKTATITIPVPSALAAAAPASIALWSFNDSSGLWRQQGTAVKTGNAYVGTVSHFSFWSGA
ncbi:MAG: carboxypeptidase regulatory-like domain-containing protein, partial [Bacteroidetes bacterium]|nr:carboxypeptidase regulatory-like domain-containing protein [Bacteroidota bacterium]